MVDVVVAVDIVVSLKPNFVIAILQSYANPQLQLSWLALVSLNFT